MGKCLVYIYTSFLEATHLQFPLGTTPKMTQYRQLRPLVRIALRVQGPGQGPGWGPECRVQYYRIFNICRSVLLWTLKDIRLY